MRRPRESKAWQEFEKVTAHSKNEHFLEEISIDGSVDVALIYPNDYAVASSSLSYHELFRRFNASPAIRCERFYYDSSFQKFYSVDSARPLDEFKIWAFSIHFELDLINIIKMLKKLKIPLNKKDRNKFHPVIMLGGAISYFSNAITEILADVVHCGDLTDEFTETVSNLESSTNRVEIIEILKKTSHISMNNKTDPVFVPQLSSSVYITSDTIFENRVLIEISRGCGRFCRFCVAGYNFGPVRYRSPEEIISLMKKYKSHTNKFGLVAATVTDYPYLDEILEFTINNGIDISVSSLRLDSLSVKLLEALKGSWQNQFTIAPEGGSQRLRNLYGKGISRDHIQIALEKGIEAGFKRVKLYFIYGSVFEISEDSEGILEIVTAAKKLGYSQIIASLNPLIPKPHTPFDNVPMPSIPELKRVERSISNSLRIPGVKADFESIRESVIQYSLSNMDCGGAEEFIKFCEKEEKLQVNTFLLNYAKKLNLERKEWKQDGKEEYSRS